MAKINLLDTQTSNLIAAGEVVERPANVVKELLENAIDAKSRTIVTEISGGGVDMIRITDNGSGMEKEDIPLCVRRHATSKIRTPEDLAAISTLGFRGEALAAISSTSRFTIMSKRREDALGHQMVMEGEEVLSFEECGCADGTTVIVQDLFFNQPARRKFLKRAQTESAAILQYLQRIAISHPEIAFKHIADGQVKLQTVGNGKLLDCIYSVYGQEFSSALTEVDHSEGALRIHGYVTRPECGRTNHNFQSFYINSRFVKSGTMRFAMEEAYKSFVKSEKFPGCVLFLTLDPEKVDVNVHPAKLEVRFDDERSIFNAVYHAVRGALNSLSNRLARDEYERAVKLSQTKPETVLPKISETKERPVPSPEVKSGAFRETKNELSLFSSAPSRGKSHLIPEENQVAPSKTVVEKISVSKLFDQPKTAEKPAPAIFSVKPAAVIEEKPAEEKPTKEEAPAPAKEEAPAEQMAMESVIPVENENNPLSLTGAIRGTVFNAYILYETSDTLYLIDKHAAHERILYEALKKNHKSESVQLFMEPLLLTLTPSESAALSEHIKEMQEAGFLLEEFGDNSFLLRGIPTEFVTLSGDAIKKLMEESAQELMLGGVGRGAGEKRFDRTLYSMACKAAVKAGIPSTDADHKWIVDKLREIDNIIVCPHGRPVLVPFTKKQIENLFLRT
ncbi:MAG: DNA mismatch repair endonuclease MutL [Ruminococcaceae bacterium]|nr:DNA mismatch repair endonuclease MutL [Oscillospiraceae bacterium]